MTAMQEFVVPKSMPSIFVIKILNYVGVVAFDFVPKFTLRDGMDTSYGVNTPQTVSIHAVAKSISQ
jgi:hypothetical protein